MDPAPVPPFDPQPDPPPRSSASPAPAASPGPSRMQIEIEYHPHSGKPCTVIPLDSAHAHESTSTRLRRQLTPSGRPPWAPFPSRADFEWAETTYMMPEANIEAQLKGHHSNFWCDNSYLDIKTVDELKMYLERAKHYVVEFREHEFEATFEGEPWHFKFFYRDPWDWLLDLVSDPTLIDEIAWYPSRKYLVIDGVRQRLRDEAYNSDKLWEMQSELPVVPGLPHCLLPLLAWLDKGRVSSHTNMHPMILRPLFLRSKIRNASGNGGGEVTGFMVQVRDRKDPDDRSQAAKIRFAKFKRDVYHRVLQTVFVDTLREKAADDSVNRVLFPRIPVLSLDGEEACTCAATRGALADFLCPRCLVRHDQLHDFFSENLEFPLRTTADMKAIYEKAKFEKFKTVAESLLQQYGLHLTENAFWALRGTDAYEAISYDLLHSDDSGKWGKHLWPLLLDVLATLGFKGMITTNHITSSMAKVPRWPGLKHFDNVTTKDINDGQSWFDIEKLLPKNSPFVHAIRAHLLTRMMMGLHCISDDQIKRKDTYQREYRKQCVKLTETYDKSFDFPKQHSLYHSTPTYETKVLTRSQMTELDAVKEAMARIRMTLKQYDAGIIERIAELAERTDTSPTDIEEMSDAPNDDHWRLGSPQNLVDSRHAMKDAVWINNLTRQMFDSDLRSFLRNTFPEEPLREDGEEIITVNHEERFDCVAINMDDPLTIGRMLFLFQCIFPSGRTEDIALVRLFKKSTWRPKTIWQNCRVLEDGRTLFILPRHLDLPGSRDLKHYPGHASSVEKYSPGGDKISRRLSGDKESPGHLQCPEITGRCDAARWTNRWFNKPKFHIILHLPAHIRRFGPAILFATEAFESFNAIIRAKSVHSNRHAPSRDIALAFAQGNRIRHLLSGGLFLLAASSANADSTSATKFSKSPAAWKSIGPGPKHLVESPSTVTSYLGLNDKQKPAHGVCTLDKVRARPIRETLTGQYLPDWSNKGGFFRTCQELTLNNGDPCRPGNFVILKRLDVIGETIVGRVEEIIQQVGSVAAHASVPDGVLIQKVTLLRGRARYGMPTILLSGHRTMHQTAVSLIPPLNVRIDKVKPKELLCTVNVQHNCLDNKCGPTGSRFVFQEREKTAQTRAEIVHTQNPADLVLNTAQMRDAVHLQRFRIDTPYLDSDEVIHQSSANELEASRKAAAEPTGKRKRKTPAVPVPAVAAAAARVEPRPLSRLRNRDQAPAV
ncbi:hypothetical protein C8R47DRAFT_1076489 [Mycena vitilis]|nr:hypothetical protein C8R47DRAFT_1076489 [Mycena vitilis]